tara:strand:+ start:3062 stop:3337 length:276 start_codon:yes stop_codon:yes gene_type:complete
MKGTKVEYEWVLEVLDEHGDIDPDPCTSYAECLERSKEHKRFDIVLVRDLGDEDRGLLDRQWAYVDKDGNFDGGFDRGVPKRFQKEVATVS